jgi:hypothetical protein
MTDTVWKVTSATVDGVLFRTKSGQDRKNTKTDNSCIVGSLKIDGVTHKCYGIIKEFYVHFMYPPPKKNTYKLNADKLADISVPWILCADCVWYETSDIHPTNGTLRVLRNNYWDKCSLHNMANTHPANVVFWPEMPFDLDHFDEDGEPIANIRNGRYDFGNNCAVLNVITHGNGPNKEI